MDEFLAHVGKKGMRWGVRKAKSSKPGSKRQKVGSRTYDAKKLSNSELKRVVDRMKLEQEYKNLNKKNSGEGKQYASRLLKNSGDKAVGALVGGVATAAVAAILASPGATRQLGKLTKLVK